MSSSTKKILLIVLFFSVCLSIPFLVIRSWFAQEVRNANYAILPMEKMHNPIFPWAGHDGLISEVKDYYEAYDLDTNDWIAQFALNSIESQKLARILTMLPRSERKYRCNISIAHWSLQLDICDSTYMESVGFVPYHYQVSLCKNGCDLSIVMWMNHNTGKNFLIGAPSLHN